MIQILNFGPLKCHLNFLESYFEFSTLFLLDPDLIKDDGIYSIYYMNFEGEGYYEVSTQVCKISSLAMTFARISAGKLYLHNIWFLITL